MTHDNCDDDWVDTRSVLGKCTITYSPTAVILTLIVTLTLTLTLTLNPNALTLNPNALTLTLKH